MKLERHCVKLRIWPVLFFMVYSLVGCFPDRVPTDPDYKAQDVRRPGIEHHVPLSGATQVNRATTITIWFDELMDETSVQNNFLVWPSVNIDSIQVIAVDPMNPEIIYAAKPGKGIFKSGDGAESWQWVTQASMQMLITDLVVSQDNSSILYAATADSGVYRSMDGGSVWQQVSSGLLEMDVLDIAVDPDDDNVIYAAMNSTGIYKSEDGGSSWNAINNGVRLAKGPAKIVINPSNSMTLYAPTRGDFILKSIDGGASWTRVRSGLFTFSFNTLVVHPEDTAMVFAGSADGGLYKTEDGGSHWTMLTGLKIQSIVLHSEDTSKVVISTPGGIYKSLDEGESWAAAGDIPSDEFVSMLAIDPVTPERLFAAAMDSGVYRSDDLGNSWTRKTNLPLNDLYVTGSFDFETWQDSTIVMAAIDSATIDTTVIFPYIYQRALAAWIAEGRRGEPPVEANPTATKMFFTGNGLLPPRTKIQVRIRGSFEDDRETPHDTTFTVYGAEDVNGNSLEVDHDFTFTTARN